MLYPLKFKPIFKDKIWGGSRIREKLGLDFAPLPNCGEAWLLSGVHDGESIITEGYLAGNTLNEVLEIYMDELVGQKVYDRFGSEFPILVKIIDAHDWLSIQVHPDDALAARRGTGYGKTEMWYILDAEPGAELISGFNQAMTREEYLSALNQGTLKEKMNYEKVAEGDVFFIPAGRVHALGPGILLAEIQQTSDTTYRIYDWNRVDASGQPRELHTELAVEAIDFSMPEHFRNGYTLEQNNPVPLVECPFFTTKLLAVDEFIELDYSDLDSFVILICLEGTVILRQEEQDYSLSAGEAMLLPATAEMIELVVEVPSRLLEVTIPSA